MESKVTTQKIAASPARGRTHSSTGWAFAGSQRQLQAYVNTPGLRERLDDAVRGAATELGGSELRWLAPLAETRYSEPADSAFWAAIARADLKAKAADWWPSKGGPVWDGVAIAGEGHSQTVVLVEAKAHTAEFAGGGMKATHPRSVELITAALEQTRERLGGESLEAWTGPDYQLANRLAWTDWLRQQGQPAVLVHVLFSDDRSNVPTTESDLLAAAEAGSARLGIRAETTDGWYGHVVLPAT